MSAVLAMSGFPPPPGHHQHTVETIWQATLTQLFDGATEVVLPTKIQDIIGNTGVMDIANRFSIYINAPTSVFLDTASDIIRILPPPQVQTSSLVNNIMAQAFSTESHTDSSPSACASSNFQLSTSIVNSKSKLAKQRLSKIPRPPNAFILYRQHHHPKVKAQHPGIHNNQISVIIGSKWRDEDAATKSKYKELAEDFKRNHILKHPEYQYQPRKPSEKKKRSSARKLSASSVMSKASNIAKSAPSPPPSVTASASETNSFTTQGALVDFTVPSFDESNKNFETNINGDLVMNDFINWDPDHLEGLISRHNVDNTDALTGGPLLPMLHSSPNPLVWRHSSTVFQEVAATEATEVDLDSLEDALSEYRKERAAMTAEAEAKASAERHENEMFYHRIMTALLPVTGVGEPTAL